MDAGRKRQLEFIGVYGSPENVRVSPSGLNLGGSMEKFDTPKVARLEMSEVIAERVVEEQVIEEQITEEQIIEDTIIEEEEIRFTMTSVTMVSEIKEVAGNGVTRGGLKLEAQVKPKEPPVEAAHKKVVAPVLRKNMSQSGVSDGKSSRSGRSLGKGAKKPTRPNLGGSGVTALKRKRTEGDTKKN